MTRVQATVWWGLPTSIVYALWMFNTNFRGPGTGYVSVEFGVLPLGSILFIGILGGGAFARMFNAVMGPRGHDREAGDRTRTRP